MSSGASLSTKGLVTEVLEAAAAIAPPPTMEPPQLEVQSPRGSVVIVIPTAINTVLMTAENIVENLRAGRAANLALPSLYKRAYLVAYETDEIAVLKE